MNKTFRILTDKTYYSLKNGEKRIVFKVHEFNFSPPFKFGIERLYYDGPINIYNLFLFSICTYYDSEPDLEIENPVI